MLASESGGLHLACRPVKLFRKSQAIFSGERAQRVDLFWRRLFVRERLVDSNAHLHILFPIGASHKGEGVHSCSSGSLLLAGCAKSTDGVAMASVTTNPDSGFFI
jgi:hypothetical protein